MMKVGNESNPYDSNGNLIGVAHHTCRLPDMGDAAILAAAEVGEKYDLAEEGPKQVPICVIISFGGFNRYQPVLLLARDT